MVGVLDSKEKIVEVICSRTRKSKNEINELIEEKKKKFSGLLTDSGAAFIVAKELNVELNAGEIGERLKVSQLGEGMNNIELLVRVLQIFSPRKFEKGGKRGVLCNLLVGDDSGSIKLTVWHKDVKKLEELGVKRNSVLFLKNVYVASFNKVLQLNLGFNGELSVQEEISAEKELPEAVDYSKKIEELKSGMNEVDVVGRVVRVFPKRVFSSGGKEGELINFSLGDGTAIVRATAWNDLALEMKNFSPGEIVRVEGAYIKEGLKGNIELHLGWKARITKSKEAKIPSLNELLKRTVKRTSINELAEGEKNIELRATIIALNKGNLFFNVCPKCGLKAERSEKGFSCSKCGDLSEVEKRLVLGFELDDGTGIIKGIAFGSTAEKMIGRKSDEIEKMLQETTPDGVIEELKEGVQGKILVGDGNVRLNPRSNEIEFILNNVSEISVVEEK